jgi:hypothetical protein
VRKSEGTSELPLLKISKTAVVNTYKTRPIPPCDSAKGAEKNSKCQYELGVGSKLLFTLLVYCFDFSDQ